MAYLAFQDLGGAAAVRNMHCVTPVADRVPTADDRLSALEWSVVAIARKDRLSSLARPSRMSVALRTIFNQRNPKLADERLEALRRMAVLTWRDGYTVPSHEVRAFITAGFTPGQYETMVDSIGVARRNRQTKFAVRTDLG